MKRPGQGRWPDTFVKLKSSMKPTQTIRVMPEEEIENNDVEFELLDQAQHANSTFQNARIDALNVRSAFAFQAATWLIWGGAIVFGFALLASSCGVTL